METERRAGIAVTAAEKRRDDISVYLQSDLLPLFSPRAFLVATLLNRNQAIGTFFARSILTCCYLHLLEDSQSRHSSVSGDEPSPRYEVNILLEPS
jgi:hypothetical protein